MTLLRDTRGLATVEAVMVLPVFLFIFTGLVMLHRMYSAKLETMVTVRECAWAFANGGCEALPPHCTVEPVDGAGLQSTLDGSGRADEFAGHFDELGKKNAQQGQTGDDGMAVLSEVGGFLTGLMGIDSGFRATASGSYRRPSVYGGGTSSVASNYALLCNEKPMDFIDIVKSIYCAVGGTCETVPKT